MPSTEVSGQVVDENGNPLAGMPVSIGTATAVTDQQGDFTLAGIPAKPGPISAGGSVAHGGGPAGLTAPVAQLLGHAVYMGAKNVIPTPLIVPKVDWSTPASFSQPSRRSRWTSPTRRCPASRSSCRPCAAGAVPASGTVQVAELPAALSVQHMPQGVSTGMLLYKVIGASVSQPVQLTLPNSQGFSPGSVLNLLTFNPRTGGHDVLAQMVVSATARR